MGRARAMPTEPPAATPSSPTRSRTRKLAAESPESRSDGRAAPAQGSGNLSPTGPSSALKFLSLRLLLVGGKGHRAHWHWAAGFSLRTCTPSA